MELLQSKIHLSFHQQCSIFPQGLKAILPYQPCALLLSHNSNTIWFHSYVDFKKQMSKGEKEKPLLTLNYREQTDDMMETKECTYGRKKETKTLNKTKNLSCFFCTFSDY